MREQPRCNLYSILTSHDLPQKCDLIKRWRTIHVAIVSLFGISSIISALVQKPNQNYPPCFNKVNTNLYTKFIIS